MSSDSRDNEIRVNPYGGHTEVMIVPDLGMVMIKNVPEGGEPEISTLMDFSGHPMDEGKIAAWINRGRASNGDRFCFDERICIVQANFALCPSHVVGTGKVMVRFGGDGKWLAFLPMFVSPHYSLAIINAQVMKAAEGGTATPVE